MKDAKLLPSKKEPADNAQKSLDQLEPSKALIHQCSSSSTSAGSASSLIKGGVDSISGGYVSGWAWNQKLPKQPVEVELVVEKKVKARGVANLFRPDLKAVGLGTGHHAYHLPIPRDLAALPDDFAIRVVGTDTLLPIHSEATGAIKLFYYPDYTSTNPYQFLIDASLPKHVTAKPGTIDDAIASARAQAHLSNERCVFHLHWTTPIIGAANDEWEAKQLKEHFTSKLRSFTGLGGVIIWTVHNVLSHDRKFAAIERDLCIEIANYATCVHLHSLKALDETKKEFPIPRNKIVILPHPSYVGVYPNYVDSPTARRRFNISDKKLVFAFLGQLRPYKGIDELIANFRKIQEMQPDVHLLIAGCPVFPFNTDTISRMVAGLSDVTVIARHILDDEIQWILNASDFVVLPYKTVLTSGSVLNALSFARPVIAPCLGMIPEVVADGENGLLYDAHHTDGLFEALRRAIAIPRNELELLRQAALTSVSELTWSKLSTGLINALDRATAQHRQTLSVSGKEVSIVANRLPGNTSRSAQVAIIILNYRHINDVQKLVTGVRNSTFQDFEIFVVDNNSPNLSFAELVSISSADTCIRTDDNVGYAAGNNIGITFVQKQDFEFIWVLNPDIEVTPTALHHLVLAAKAQTDVKVFGSVICYGHDKTRVWYGGASVNFNYGMRTGHQFNGMEQSALPKQPYSTEYITGASLFCRPSAFLSGGLIPEDYFLYFEETDWCLQMREHGERLIVVPDSVLYHHKRSEEGNIPARHYFYYYIRNALQFTRRFRPDAVRATEIKLRNEFIYPWLSKIARSKPTQVAIYEALAEAGLADGKAGRWGKRDLLEITFAAEHSGGKVADGPFEGYIDVIDEVQIVGWAMAPASPKARVRVSLIINGEHVETTLANRFRQDLLDLKIGDGQYGYSFVPPPTMLNGRSHLVSIYVEGHSLGSSKTVTFPQRRRYRGRIDGMSGQFIRGWALNECDPLEKPVVQLWHGEEIISIGQCTQFRPDLLASNLGDGCHGFEIRVPTRFADGQSYDFRLRRLGDNVDLAMRSIKAQKPTNLLPGKSLNEDLAWLFQHREMRFLPDQTAPALTYFNQTSQILVNTYRDQPQRTLVTVIMPAFNRANTIEASIRSVLNQSYRNLELLVIDDGSTDDTCQTVLSIINSLRDDRICLIRLNINSGVSVARNTGLSKAKGTIISYLDSDNIWNPDYLMVMVNSLMDNDTSDSAYCGQSIWHTIQQPGSHLDELISIRAGAFWMSLIENRNYIDLNCFVHRTELSKRLGGFNENMRRLVDWELIWRYTSYKGPIFVPVLLSKYFMGRANNQITHLEHYETNLNLIESSFQHHRESMIEILSNTNSLEPNFDIIVPCLDEKNVDFSSIECALAAAPGSSRKIFIASMIGSSKSEALIQRYGDDKRIELMLLEGGLAATPGNIVQKVIDGNPSTGGIVLLAENAMIEKNCLLHMAHATCFISNTGAVIGQHLVDGKHPLARTISPYSSSVFPVDVSLFNGSIDIIDSLLDVNNHLMEVSAANHLCTMFTTKVLSRLRFSAVECNDFKSLLDQLSATIRLTFGMRIVYAGRARTAEN